MTAHEFNQFFLKYKDKFIAIALSYVHDRMVAEDVVAECFMNFWLVSRSGNGSESEIRTIPEAYVVRSIKNRCLNHLRDRQNHEKILNNVGEEAQRAFEARIRAFEAEEINNLFTREVIDVLKKCMETMPDETREIFMLSRHEELTYKEIARKRGISERMVKRHISKALDLLKGTISKYFPVFIYFFTNISHF